MRIILCLIIASTLAGCASNQVAQSASIEQQAQEQAASQTLSPQEVIVQSEEKLKEAQLEDLSFYSPRYLEHAKKAFVNANIFIKKEGQETLALTAALESQSYVDAGLNNKEIVIENLAPVLEKKQQLETIESPKFHMSDYNAVIDDISNMIQQIEAGKLIEALEDQPVVLKSMIDVEIDTLKTVHLTDAINMLEKAEDDDADTYAKATYNEADKIIDKASDFIEKHYADREQVEAKGIDALKAAQHAFYVAIEAQQLISIKAETAEEHILKIEKLFHRIGTGFSHEDIRYMSLSDQSTILAQQAEIIGKRLHNRPTVQEKALWENNKQLLLTEIETLRAQLDAHENANNDDTKNEEETLTPVSPTDTPADASEANIDVNAKTVPTAENKSTQAINVDTLTEDTAQATPSAIIQAEPVIQATPNTITQAEPEMAQTESETQTPALKIDESAKPTHVENSEEAEPISETNVQ